MKKIWIVLLGVFLLSGCGAKDSDNLLPAETNQTDGSASNMEQTEEPEQEESPEQAQETKPEERADVSGIYTDKQGTADVYSQLTLDLQKDGSYAVKISVYRTTELEGTAVWEGDVLRFTGEDPYVVADIFVTGSKAEVTVITDIAGVLTGDVYSFPDGAPGENSEQTQEDLSGQNLSEKIARVISDAEEREKELDKKIEEMQEEAVTQSEMNATAEETYRLWDDTLNAVWKLLEESLSETDMEALREEEREWIAFKDAKMQAAGEENGGGSLEPLLEAMKGAELTKARVYELEDYVK